jgi:hypothetical protein
VLPPQGAVAVAVAACLTAKGEAVANPPRRRAEKCWTRILYCWGGGGGGRIASSGDGMGNVECYQGQLGMMCGDGGGGGGGGGSWEGKWATGSTRKHRLI